MATNNTELSDWEGALVVKPNVAWKMLACSNTRGYELIAAKELDSFLDGRSRKITVASIRRYIAQRLAQTDNSVKTDAHRRRRGQPRRQAA